MKAGAAGSLVKVRDTGFDLVDNQGVVVEEDTAAGGNEENRTHTSHYHFYLRIASLNLSGRHGAIAQEPAMLANDCVQGFAQALFQTSAKICLTKKIFATKRYNLHHKF